MLQLNKIFPLGVYLSVFNTDCTGEVLTVDEPQNLASIKS